MLHLLGVRLPVVNCMYNKKVDSYPSHLRVVRFGILFVVRAERSVRFYNEWGSWLDVLTWECVVACVDLKAWEYQNRLDGRLLAVSLESREIKISIRC